MLTEVVKYRNSVRTITSTSKTKSILGLSSSDLSVVIISFMFGCSVVAVGLKHCSMTTGSFRI